MSKATKTPVSKSKHLDASQHTGRPSRKSPHAKRRRDDEPDESQASPSKKRRREGDDHAEHKYHKKHKKSSKEKSSLKESQQSTQSQTTPPPKPSPSPFSLQTTSLYLPLSPISQSSPTHGLCAEHLSPLILTYVPALRGILLSYSNARISTKPPHAALSEARDEIVLGKSMDEYAFSYAWLTADFLVLKPVIGAEMEGYVNLQNESRLGVLCWNLFNASVERKRLPKEWRWDGPTSRRRIAPRRKETDEDANDEQESDTDSKDEDEADGGFLDGLGEAVMGRKVTFKIVDWELDQSGRPADASASTSSLVSFEGTMLSEEDEDKLLREAKIKEADRLAAIRNAREKRINARRKARSEETDDG